jgi:hypothetical protein
LGELVQVRLVQYADERWRRTFTTADPSRGEQQRLAEAIRLLRRSDLPMANDIEVSMPPLMEIKHFRHVVTGTSLRLVYDFKDEPPEHVLYLISLHRVGGYGPRAA